MPQLADIVNHTGLGAITSPGGKLAPTSDGWFWLMTLIAPFAGAAQATLWAEAVLHWRRERESFATGLLLTNLLMLLPSIGYVFFWDRYLLVFLPYAAFIVLRRTRLSRAGWFAAVVVSAALMLYTIVGMGDYLAWMTARWNAAEALVAQGIAPESIDAGIEWVGWHELETAQPEKAMNYWAGRK